MDLTLPIVSVRGSSVLEVDPEVASVDVAVGARDKDRDRTLSRVDERSSGVLALVAPYAERVETASVRIGPELKDGKPGERVTGYHAVVRHTVLVADFARLGDLVARLGELEMVDVSGPWWRLRSDSAVYRDARVAAARDAVVRASEYASALGSRVVGLVEMADIGLLSEAAQAPFAAAAMPSAPMRAASVAPAPVTLDLEPARQVVRANVEARFRIDAPPPERLA